MSVRVAVLLGCTVAVSAVLTVVARAWGRRYALDPVTERSSHVRPVPRVGGVAVALSAVASWVAVRAAAGDVIDGGLWAAVLWSGVVAAATGLLDDLFTLSPLSKLAGQIAALMPPILILAPLLWPPSAPIAVLAWVLMTAGYANLFNFMDGSDGLAGGVAAINALAFALIASTNLSLMWSLLLGASALGFLIFNYPPASVFMGDSGSLFLGCGFAVAAALLIAEGVSPVAVLIAISPFAVDGGFTLATRLLRGKPVWQAHRSHLYQRLLSAGWSHRDVAWLYWSWAAVAGASAANYVRMAVLPRSASLAIAIGTPLVIMLVVGLAEHTIDSRIPERQ